MGLMPNSDTALIVIDVQESFRQESCWADNPQFFTNLQKLVDGARQQGIPVVQVFHVEDSGTFSVASGLVKTLHEVSVVPDATFHKTRHSALIGSGLGIWLVEKGIRKVIISGIRTEQCCETTARHASDMGYQVDFCTEATLTFDMTDRHGKVWRTEEIMAATELVLDGRFARIVTVDNAIDSLPA
jgi:nicotinamidase-related amidase